MSTPEITPDNIKNILDEKVKESLLLPIKPIQEVEYTPPNYLIEDLLVSDTVGFISASPGSTKTWLAWEMALSLATGTRCFGVFETQKGKVIAFNAEDSPGAVTRPRVEALAAGKGVSLKDADFHLVDVSTLLIDDTRTQDRMRATIKEYQPRLVILDPLRQVHLQNEDKASDMAPLLAFLRQLQRDFGCSILLVCHERKGSGVQGERREDRTRGSNALEGWRDTAIYIDRKSNKDATKVGIYHRGYLSPEGFFFTLEVESSEGKMASAVLNYQTEQDRKRSEMAKLCEMAFDFIKKSGETTTGEISEGINRRKSQVVEAVDKLLMNGCVKREKRKLVAAGSFRIGDENVPF